MNTNLNNDNGTKRTEFKLELQTKISILINSNGKSSLFLEKVDKVNDKGIKQSYIKGSMTGIFSFPDKVQTGVNPIKITFTTDTKNWNFLINRTSDFITEMEFKGPEKNIQFLEGVYDGKPWNRINLRNLNINNWDIKRTKQLSKNSLSSLKL